MGEDIKEVRKFLRLSQFKVSLECGWGSNYVGHVENGQIKNISFKNAHKMAVFFIEELQKKGYTVKELEEYIGYFPFLDLLYVVEEKGRILEDVEPFFD